MQREWLVDFVESREQAFRERTMDSFEVHGARGTTGREEGNRGAKWFRDLDSNQDTQLQRLMSYQLDDPGIDARIVAE